MAENTKIQWAHHTFNPWRGCTKVSAGCKHCYAEQQAGRNPRSLGVWGPNGTRALAAEAYWKQPIKWDGEAAAAGERRRVFCGSLMDIFESEDTMPASAHDAVRTARYRVFDLIDATPNLDWLLVTKRPENIRPMWLGGAFQADGRPSRAKRRQNVWLIGSIEDQASADRVIPELVNCLHLAPVLGLSAEPLIGPVDVVSTCRRLIDAACQRQQICPPPKPLTDAHAATAWGNLLDWVIVGGESEQAGKCRPCDVAWIRSIVEQCKTAGVACFVKQLGSDCSETIVVDEAGRTAIERLDLNDSKGGDPDEWPFELRVRQFPDFRR